MCMVVGQQHIVTHAGIDVGYLHHARMRVVVTMQHNSRLAGGLWRIDENGMMLLIVLHRYQGVMDEVALGQAVYPGFNLWVVIDDVRKPVFVGHVDGVRASQRVFNHVYTATNDCQ